MAEQARMEVRTIGGREVKLRWKSPRFGEWLAWCYVPGPNLLPHEGVGFEARAATADAAREAVIAQVEEFIQGS